MRVVILGAGRRGLRLAQHLIDERKSVVFLDSSSERCSAATAKLDCMSVCGSATDIEMLREAGCEGAEAVIAVTDSDETNLVACGIIASSFHDVGMTIVVSLIWGFQLFLAGLPIVLVAVLGLIAVAGAVGAYFTFDHVHDRVQQFLASGDNLGYQVRKSLEAFESGNLLGRGPGEGIVKLNLPDAHTDFIFAVAGEEFGIWLCIMLVMLFGVIVIRSLWLSLKDNNLFIVYASAGLAASFGLQGIINMASTLHLMPTKGMTLPFISYGGSSLFASAVTIGMLLAITRKNSSAEDKDDPF